MNNIHYKCQLFVIAFLSAKNKNVTTPVDAEKVNKNYFLDIEPQNYEPQIISLSRQLPIMIGKNGIGNVMYFLSIKQKDIYGNTGYGNSFGRLFKRNFTRTLITV